MMTGSCVKCWSSHTPEDKSVSDFVYTQAVSGFTIFTLKNYSGQGGFNGWFALSKQDPRSHSTVLNLYRSTVVGGTGKTSTRELNRE